MKVLWVSRHSPGDDELTELGKIYGADTLVEQYTEQKVVVEGLSLTIQKYDYDIVCASLPVKLNQMLLRVLLIPLIRPVYYHRDAHGNVTAGNRGKFVGFERVYRIEVLSERIGTWSNTASNAGDATSVRE